MTLHLNSGQLQSRCHIPWNDDQERNSYVSKLVVELLNLLKFLQLSRKHNLWIRNKSNNYKFYILIVYLLAELAN